MVNKRIYIYYEYSLEIIVRFGVAWLYYGAVLLTTTILESEHNPCHPSIFLFTLISSSRPSLPPSLLALSPFLLFLYPSITSSSFPPSIPSHPLSFSSLPPTICLSFLLLLPSLPLSMFLFQISIRVLSTVVEILVQHSI